MSEEFLYYIWSNKLFQPELESTSGEQIVVENTGYRNDHAGPDYLDARIRMDDTLWAGNIEIHHKASDWFKHGHESNKAYQKIILHVVYEADTEVRSEDGSPIPCLELKGKFSELLYHRWKKLLGSHKWIACDELVGQVPEVYIHSALDALLIERFESKVAEIDALLHATGNDWEATFFRALAKNFGFHVNAGPFEVLARSFDFKIFRKYQDQPVLLEALLFGQAGLLNEKLDDAYNQNLIKEYDYLSHKHQLIPMLGQTWRFMRMRPVNFPTIRIAQLVALYHHNKHLFGEIIDRPKLEDVQHLFEVQASEYWDQHYTFGQQSSRTKAKKLGKSSFDLLLINTIAPLMFAYGRRHLREDLSERAIDFLYQCKAEDNSIVKKWAKSGISAQHAGHSQALLQLKKKYCSYTKCLQCQIGNYLISNT